MLLKKNGKLTNLTVLVLAAARNAPTASRANPAGGTAGDYVLYGNNLVL
jgi:hypothetical protein